MLSEKKITRAIAIAIFVMTLWAIGFDARTELQALWLYSRTRALFIVSLCLHCMWGFECCMGYVIYDPRHEISNNVVYATSKVSDQPAHTRSLIGAFASRLNILRVFSYGLNIIWGFLA